MSKQLVEPSSCGSPLASSSWRTSVPGKIHRAYALQEAQVNVRSKKNVCKFECVCAKWEQKRARKKFFSSCGNFMCHLFCVSKWVDSCAKKLKQAWIQWIRHDFCVSNYAVSSAKLCGQECERLVSAQNSSLLQALLQACLLNPGVVVQQNLAEEKYELSEGKTTKKKVHWSRFPLPLNVTSNSFL